MTRTRRRKRRNHPASFKAQVALAKMPISANVGRLIPVPARRNHQNAILFSASLKVVRVGAVLEPAAKHWRRGQPKIYDGIPRAHGQKTTGPIGHSAGPIERATLGG